MNKSGLLERSFPFLFLTAISAGRVWGAPEKGGAFLAQLKADAGADVKLGPNPGRASHRARQSVTASDRSEQRRWEPRGRRPPLGCRASGLTAGQGDRRENGTTHLFHGHLRPRLRGTLTGICLCGSQTYRDVCSGGSSSAAKVQDGN